MVKHSIGSITVKRGTFQTTDLNLKGVRTTDPDLIVKFAKEEETCSGCCFAVVSPIAETDLLTQISCQDK